MKIEIFTLCDFASVDGSGKLNIIGAFDRINAFKAPVLWPRGAIAATIRFERVEEGPKRIGISLVDCDGKVVMPPQESQITVGVEDGEMTATIPFVFLLPPLMLPSFGDYSFDLKIDGRHEMSLPLCIRPARRPAQEFLTNDQSG